MKAVVRKVARIFGLELARYRVATSSVARLQRIFTYQKVDLVLDVGANVGQFAMTIRSAGYRGKIVSFEPVSAAHHALLRNSRRDPLWSVAPQVAIGAEEGSVDINVSQNSYSSSILDVLDTHVRSDNTACYVGRENVRVTRLDTVSSPYLDGSTSAFLKVDTQGYEALVLAGARSTLKRVVGVQLELSLVPLYNGQPLFLDLVETMREAGFVLCGVVPGFADEHTGRLLQLDGVFLKSTALPAER